MIRNWKLMGDIFNEIEKETLEEFVDAIKNNSTEHFVSREFKELMRHIEMLIDAGYIKGVEVAFRGDQFYLHLDNPRITLQGYDFADTVKDKALLNKTLAAIKEAGLIASFETIKQFAPVVVKTIAKELYNRVVHQ